jgi:hypothetical protein
MLKTFSKGKIFQNGNNKKKFQKYQKYQKNENVQSLVNYNSTKIKT